MPPNLRLVHTGSALSTASEQTENDEQESVDLDPSRLEEMLLYEQASTSPAPSDQGRPVVVLVVIAVAVSAQVDAVHEWLVVSSMISSSKRLPFESFPQFKLDSERPRVGIFGAILAVSCTAVSNDEGPCARGGIANSRSWEESFEPAK